LQIDSFSKVYLHTSHMDKHDYAGFNEQMSNWNWYPPTYDTARNHSKTKLHYVTGACNSVVLSASAWHVGVRLQYPDTADMIYLM